MQTKQTDYSEYYEAIWIMEKEKMQLKVNHFKVNLDFPADDQFKVDLVISEFDE